jgi:hypothetical protein
MYAQPLADAIAEAERRVSEAHFIESEADLLEGLQYLAGCIAACTHVAFDYERDHPFLHTGTGPFTKMGLDNPDTMYFGTRVLPGHEYVVSGRRGTTTDVSFQLLLRHRACRYGGQRAAAIDQGIARKALCHCG